MSESLEKKRLKYNMYLLLLAISVISALLASFVIGQAPVPHNIAGKVFANGTNGVQNGVPVSINNTALNEITYTEVFAPLVPALRGAYSAAINGTDGDIVVVLSWNQTHFGNASASLLSTTTTIDINLNYSRASEANITAVSPANNTKKNKSIEFNITANITILGNNGISCNATINFSDLSILNMSLGKNYTIELGNIDFENTVIVNWTVIGLNSGSSNATINAYCESDGKNILHTNIKSILNITILNQVPLISNVFIQNPIDLDAGNNVTVICNATVTDGNKFEDIRLVNATFFQSSIGDNSPDDNNFHYSNSSCLNISSSAFEENYTCTFSAAYYTNNGTWQCNVTATDFSNSTGFDNKSTSINELLSISIEPSILDYGLLQAANISNDENLTIKNIGNVPFNLTVYSFAPNESLAYLNLSMNCPEGNISNANQRFSNTNGTNFNNMKKLNNVSQNVNLTLPQRTDDLAAGNDTNFTYWKLEVPSIKGGVCNGTLLFSAIPLG
jgi:hypothetical protein